MKSRFALLALVGVAMILLGSTAMAGVAVDCRICTLNQSQYPLNYLAGFNDTDPLLPPSPEWTVRQGFVVPDECGVLALTSIKLFAYDAGGTAQYTLGILDAISSVFYSFDSGALGSSSADAEINFSTGNPLLFLQPGQLYYLTLAGDTSSAPAVGMAGQIGVDDAYPGYFAEWTSTSVPALWPNAVWDNADPTDLYFCLGLDDPTTDIPEVPEPFSMAIWGAMAACGLGLSRFRRK